MPCQPQYLFGLNIKLLFGTKFQSFLFSLGNSVLCPKADCTVAPRSLGEVQRFVCLVDQSPERIFVSDFFL